MQTQEIAENTTLKMPNALKSEEWSDTGMENEVWKSVLEYEGYYEVSNLGRVRSIDRIIKKKLYLGKIIKESDNQGYKMVNLSKNSKGKGKLVHRLVAYSFLDNPNGYPDVNHKDLNKTNNKLYNLEWISEKQNTEHAIKNGAMNYLFGEKNFRSIFTYNQITDIRKEYWESLLSTSDLATKYNASKACIVAIISNYHWCDEEYQKILDSKGKRKYRNIGAKNGAAKLNQFQVLEIRELSKNGETTNSLAVKFGLSWAGMNKIIIRETWKHI